MGLEPGEEGLKVQTNPLSYGGTPLTKLVKILLLKSFPLMKKLNSDMEIFI